ncbi:RNA polymerase sigma-70 factor [Pedobacter heparinus]|uniref:RNA polymerase sigma factor n=1 Tax=Pedobacter heparinus TaxID=984 RepID=UPI00293001CC|nr:RNA polymerase sigma-70 factor [Pedobacter heparinus]
MKDFTLLTDHELLVLLRDGNHKAFLEIYHRYKAILYLHACKRLNGNTEDAKDLIQELFTTIWHKHADLLITENLSAYLFTSVRNRVIKFIYRNKSAHRYLSSLDKSITEGHSITDHRLRENELRRLIATEIDALPPRMREIFLLSRKEGWSQREIAHHLNLSESTVKKQVQNALKILRIKLGLLVWLLVYLWRF